MVARPVATYAAIVWWPRVKYKTIKVRLTKLQRISCLGITGAKKTAPTAVTEVLLVLPSLHLQLEAEARAGIYKAYCRDQWKPKLKVMDTHT
jgi:hypothetical protein